MQPNIEIFYAQTSGSRSYRVENRSKNDLAKLDVGAMRSMGTRPDFLQQLD